MSRRARSRRGRTDEYETVGALRAETPFFESRERKLFADDANRDAFDGLPVDATLTARLRVHSSRLRPGDYFGLLAYIEATPAHWKTLQLIRDTVRDSLHVATCVGFGPRFLHSTGQVYKGGPNSGVFLQLTCDDIIDVAVPHRRYTFGVVKAAQARGDFAVLAERGRRALRVHMGSDVRTGLTALATSIRAALADR